MSIADLLDDWFESPQVKGLMAVNGIIGTWAGPCEPGTAYVMAHHSIGDVGDGQLGSWGYPEGGMGAVSEAIARSARELRRRDPHQRQGFQRADARRPGPRRGAGERRGDHRAAGGHHAAPEDRLPRPPFAHTNCPTTSSRDIEHWKTRSGVVKINLALSELPELHRRPEFGDGRAPHRVRSRWRRRWSTSSAAFQDARVGKPALLPFSDGVIPTTLDKTLNPDGTHIMSLFTQWVPARVGRRAAHRGTRRLRRPGDRHLRPGGARTSRRRSRTATSSARTRWSRSTA